MDDDLHMSIPEHMMAMVMERPGQSLIYKSVPIPVPFPQQVLVKIIACGVCRTDLHIMDSELAHPKLPLIPGHEIVGTVVQTGGAVRTFTYGNPSGAPLLCAGLIGYRSCGMIGPQVERLGIYGFGAAAHILILVALFQGEKDLCFYPGRGPGIAGICY